MHYEWGYHSSDINHVHVALVQDGERDELFDVAFYHVEDGSLDDSTRLESLEALGQLLNRANAIPEAFKRIERMTEEAEARIPEGSEYEAMEEHGYIEALNNVTNMLHLLALGKTPAQGSEKP